MKLRVKIIDVETGGLPVVVLNEEFARSNAIHAKDRVIVRKGKRKLVCVVDYSERIIKDGEIGVFEEVWKKLALKEGDLVEVEPTEKPKSSDYIRKKLDGIELEEEEIKQIVKDVMEDKLTEAEVTAFITACHMKGLTVEEIYYLTKAVADSGAKLRLGGIVLDKHSIGGVCGGRVSMLIVPIIASLGFKIPKTSSRAITTPAGTADAMEVLAKVSFSIKELYSILRKTNGFIVWGGAINLAPADDKFIRARNPLALDPYGMMVASILGKKVAVDATHVVIDVPMGWEAKIRHIGEARYLERLFVDVANKFGMKVKVVVTDGNQPIGYGIGPALEARDVLYCLRNDKRAPQDLIEKALILCDALLSLVGVENGYKKARQCLRSGRAYRKMKQIIKAQRGDPRIKPRDIKLGKYRVEYKADRSGRITYLSNRQVIKLARIAGAPLDKEAGVYLWKKVGDDVKKGEVLMTIYTVNEFKLKELRKALRVLKPYRIE